MIQYFPRPYEPFGRDINVKVDLSNYATKADLKNVTGLDTSKLALKSNLANLTAEVDKIDLDKSNTVPVGLSKLSNVVNNDVVKKTVHDKSVAKVNNIDISGSVSKTKYDKKKKTSDANKKIPDTKGLVKKTDYNSKITVLENKIPSISGLAANSALTAVENKIPDIGSLVKKTDYNAKNNEIEKKVTDHNHDKYITTPEFEKFTEELFATRLAQANLITKTDFDTKLISLNRKINSNKTKHLLVENELKRLQTFDSIYFRDKSHFKEDGTQNYLVF